MSKFEEAMETIRETVNDYMAVEEDFIHENGQLVNLVKDAIDLLNVFCEKCDGDTCPAWPKHSEQCELRDLEDRMRDLGIKVGE